MESFTGKIAVVTGGASGMGRELVRQLTAQGCHVALCDLSVEEMEETRRLALADAPEGTVVTTHVCDVSDEARRWRFRDAVVARAPAPTTCTCCSTTPASVAAAAVITDPPRGVGTDLQRLLGRRVPRHAHVPAVADRRRRGPHRQHVERQRVLGAHRTRHGRTRPTRAAKFAVKGFTEALITDLRRQRSARQGAPSSCRATSARRSSRTRCATAPMNSTWRPPRWCS